MMSFTLPHALRTQLLVHGILIPKCGCRCMQSIRLGVNCLLLGVGPIEMSSRNPRQKGGLEDMQEQNVYP